MSGRVALVTGAGGDIGRSVARRLAADGAHVALADLNSQADAVEATAELCRQAAPGARVHTVLFDVVDEAAVDQAVSHVVAELGVPEALFNNAGYQGRIVNAADYPADDFRRVLDVNVLGIFHVLRSTARAMRTAGAPGAIVNTASMAGVGGAPNMIAYSASKSAVIGLTKTAAKDLAPDGIRVNCVSPGFIGPGVMWDRQVDLQAAAASQYYSDDATEVSVQMISQIPLRRVGSVEEVAAAVEFLLSTASSFISGHNLEISGGSS